MISHPRFVLRNTAVTTSGLGVIALSVLAAAYAGCGGSTNNKSTSDGGSSGDDAAVTVEASVDTGTTSMDSGSTTSNDSGSSAKDAAPDANHGAPSTTYPAFPVDVGQVANNGGTVLATPHIVTVTFTGDPNIATFNALSDSIGASSYWHGINSEYGVGPTTSAMTDHVTMPVPAELDDSSVDAYVEAHAGVDWPAPDANTLYMIYTPPGQPFYFGGTPDAGGQDACGTGVGGYHSQSQNKGLVYGITLQCSMFKLADNELTFSHELNEAATDPHVNPTSMATSAGPAWVGFDADHAAFEIFNSWQDELGDACESFVEAPDAIDFTPYTVQRQWSNATAKKGSHWCLPALAEPFYNTTFLLGTLPAGVPTTQLDSITVNPNALGSQGMSYQSKGFKIPAGGTRTFPIGLFSDQDTMADFTIDVQGLSNPIGQDQNGNNIANGVGTVTIDKPSGRNGDIAYVTVNVTSYGPANALFFYIRSVLPNAQQHHYLPVLVSAN